MDRLISWLILIGTFLFLVLVSALIALIPSMALAWIVLKIFPQITLSFVQMTTIFVVLGVLFRTKITVKKD